MEKSFLQDGRPCFKCTLCGKHNSMKKANVRNHIESVHFPGHFSYNCNHCKKTFKSKSALCVHVSKVHRDEKLWCTTCLLLVQYSCSCDLINNQLFRINGHNLCYFFYSTHQFSPCNIWTSRRVRWKKGVWPVHGEVLASGWEAMLQVHPVWKAKLTEDQCSKSHWKFSLPWSLQLQL